MGDPIPDQWPPVKPEMFYCLCFLAYYDVGIANCETSILMDWACECFLGSYLISIGADGGGCLAGTDLYTGEEDEHVAYDIFWISEQGVDYADCWSKGCEHYKP